MTPSTARPRIRPVPARAPCPVRAVWGRPVVPLRTSATSKRAGATRRASKVFHVITRPGRFARGPRRVRQGGNGGERGQERSTGVRPFTRIPVGRRAAHGPQRLSDDPAHVPIPPSLGSYRRSVPAGGDAAGYHPTGRARALSKKGWSAVARPAMPVVTRAAARDHVTEDVHQPKEGHDPGREHGPEAPRSCRGAVMPVRGPLGAHRPPGTTPSVRLDP